MTIQHKSIHALQILVAEKDYQELNILVAHNQDSRDVQTTLFRLGYNWTNESSVKVLNSGQPLLHINETTKTITYRSEWFCSEDLIIISNA